MYSFSQRTINVWNTLSNDCVHASSDHLFKNRIDNERRTTLKTTLQCVILKFECFNTRQDKTRQDKTLFDNETKYESLLLYEPYANVSSQICHFLGLRPQFHSNPSVHVSTPIYCQSATFGRLTFCVYPVPFLRNSRLMSPRPPRARHAHRANRPAAS